MELIVGDKVVYREKVYYISDIYKKLNSVIYQIHDTMNTVIDLSEEDMIYLEVDRKYGQIIRGMDEILAQDVITNKFNYVFRYGIYKKRLYRLTAYASPYVMWNDNSAIAHTFPEEVFGSISYDEELYLLVDHRIFWIRAGKYCNGKTLDEIKEYMITHPQLVLTKNPGRKYTKDFIIGVHQPIFQRYNGNTNKNTFDTVRIEIILKERDNMMQQCIDHKKEILDAAVDKLKSSKSFRKYGVPINFLKVYDMVLTKDNCIILSLCLKEHKDDTN